MTHPARDPIVVPLVLLLGLAGACAASGSKESEPAPAAVIHPTWEGGSEIASSDRTWRIVYKVAGGAIPRGESFSLDAWVFAADAPGTPRTDVSLAVDAGMPQHGHGMNRVPHVEKLEAGRFKVDGLLFHMSGRWQLYFDVGSGPLVERAQVDVEVE